MLFLEIQCAVAYGLHRHSGRVEIEHPGVVHKWSSLCEELSLFWRDYLTVLSQNCFMCRWTCFFFELETICEVDICPVGPHHGSGTCKICAQVLRREFIQRTICRFEATMAAVIREPIRNVFIKLCFSVYSGMWVLCIKHYIHLLHALWKGGLSLLLPANRPHAPPVFKKRTFVFKSTRMCWRA